MESTPEQVAEGLIVVRVLGAVLERLVKANESLVSVDTGQITKFHALKAPSIGISQYLERIHKYASCSTECFILALIYIDRLIQVNNFILTELNVHRVAITSILLAAKFFDDAYYNNAYYAKVGGVLVSEMNRLEVEFLFRINFALHVSPELYNKYHAELNAHAANEIPISSSTMIVQRVDAPESPHQVPMVSCNHQLESVLSLPSHVLVSCGNERTNDYTDPKHTLYDTKQFVSGVPIQITPSPTPPQLHNVTDPTTNPFWQKNIFTREAEYNSSICAIQGVQEMTSETAPNEYQPIAVVHHNYPVLVQPKLQRTWNEQQSVPTSNFQKNFGTFCYDTNPGQTMCARSVCNSSPSYSNDSSSMYAGYSQYNDNIYDYPNQVAISNHQQKFFQHHSSSTMPAAVTPSGTVGFYGRISSEGW